MLYRFEMSMFPSVETHCTVSLVLTQFGKHIRAFRPETQHKYANTNDSARSARCKRSALLYKLTERSYATAAVQTLSTEGGDRGQIREDLLSLKQSQKLIVDKKRTVSCFTSSVGMEKR